jgi:hypothetical protein
MKFNLRLFIAVIVLAASLTLLIWGFWPSKRETHILPVHPAEMTLPTPTTFLLDLAPAPASQI